MIDSARARSDESGRDEPNSGRTSQVLVVEDDQALARLMEALLLSEGYAVRRAADGQAALDAVRGERPDLILLDLTLPRLDGWQVLERLRALPKPPPVALLTGLSGVRHRASEAGAAATVQKPFDVDDLLRTVARLLGRVP